MEKGSFKIKVGLAEMLKGGVFMYPGTIDKPNGKLRLLYEGFPMAFLARPGNYFDWAPSATHLSLDDTGHPPETAATDSTLNPSVTPNQPPSSRDPRQRSA